jgi:anti-sigma regulatory factor (Ser/Thr protein kinase)
MEEREFPRDIGALDGLFGFVRAFLRSRGLPEDAGWNVDLVLEELFTNIVKYGRPSSAPVRVGFDWQQPLLTLRVTDTDSDFFDPTVEPGADTTRPIEERTPGKLGLHFVRQVAERFEYVYEGRTSRITVSLRQES